MDETLHLKLSGAVATIRLTRPQFHNAVDPQLAATLAQAFQKLGVAEMVRVVVLEGEGESFCAGADLAWLKRIGEAETALDAQREAMALAVVLDSIHRCPKPVIAVVRGAALGLGLGMVAAADMAIAADKASFAATETRLGLPPAIIAPYVAEAMGARACRRYLLTGERFDPREAVRLGLLHGHFSVDMLDAARDHLIQACLAAAPQAQSGAKEILRLAADTPLGPDFMRLSALRLAETAGSDEGREGVAAALEGRKPQW